MRILRLLTFCFGGAALALGVFVYSFGALKNVSLQLEEAQAQPPVLASFEGDAPILTSNAWTARRAPLLRAAFQARIYGVFPPTMPVRVTSRTSLGVLDPFGGSAEQWDVRIGADSDDLRFNMVVIFPEPRADDMPTPMIIVQNFCGNVIAFPGVAGVVGPRYGSPQECENAAMRPLVPLVFGNAVMTPPRDMILPRGYGVAVLYAGDIVPDEAQSAMAPLQALTPKGTPPEQRTGAIAAWAWTYLRALDALRADPRVDGRRIALWGHSRNGKAALLAAAMDPHPAAVVALQSGTGGASLGRDDLGESIADVTRAFPHWFAPAFESYATAPSSLPIDQHQLLALIAPRPALIAAARRDGWADPAGAFHAIEAAAPVYELFGVHPFTQTRLDSWDVSSPQAFYIRPGLHGVHRTDWERTLDFLDAQLNAAPVSPNAD